MFCKLLIAFILCVAAFNVSFAAYHDRYKDELPYLRQDNKQSGKSKSQQTPTRTTTQQATMQRVSAKYQASTKYTKPKPFLISAVPFISIGLTHGSAKVTRKLGIFEGTNQAYNPNERLGILISATSNESKKLSSMPGILINGGYFITLAKRYVVSPNIFYHATDTSYANTTGVGEYKTIELNGAFGGGLDFGLTTKNKVFVGLFGTGLQKGMYKITSRSNNLTSNVSSVAPYYRAKFIFKIKHAGFFAGYTISNSTVSDSTNKQKYSVSTSSADLGLFWIF